MYLAQLERTLQTPFEFCSSKPRINIIPNQNIKKGIFIKDENFNNIHSVKRIFNHWPSKKLINRKVWYLLILNSCNALSNFNSWPTGTSLWYRFSNSKVVNPLEAQLKTQFQLEFRILLPKCHQSSLSTSAALPSLSCLVFFRSWMSESVYYLVTARVLETRISAQSYHFEKSSNMSALENGFKKRNKSLVRIAF